MKESNLFVPFSRDLAIKIRRRNLPHWEQSDRTYFVTFRLADSLPQSKLRALAQDKLRWLEQHPEPWDPATWKAYCQFERRVQQWLDAGYGSCLLREPAALHIMSSAFLHFDQQRYFMDAFALMPNHVHLICKPCAGFRLETLLHSWKSFTAKQINQVHNRQGTVWMDENFDHIVRSESQLEHFRTYIFENPTKAGLRSGCFVGRGSGIVTVRV